MLWIWLWTAALAFGANLRDVEFARPGGVPLTLDAHIPESKTPQPAVLLVHGGGWEAGDKRTYIGPWFTTLTAARIAWFSIDYRLAPQWKHPAAVEDIQSAYAWIQSNAARLGVDPRRIAIMGESAGGHLALLAGFTANSKPAALVSFYGVHDLPLWFEQRGEVPRNIGQFLPGRTLEVYHALSPVHHVRRGSPPMLLIHGTADTGVPAEQSAALCRAASKVGVACELFLLEGAPHGVENWEKDPRFHAWKPKLIAWLNKTLNRR